MFIRFPYWRVAHCHTDDGGTGDGTDNKNDGTGEKGAGSGPDAATLAKENAELKARLGSVGTRLDKLDQLEKDRADRAKAKEDADRLKKEGAEKLLGEKDTELKEANARIEKFEKDQREKADAAYEKLPDEVKAAIGPLKEKLDVTDWVSTVEAQTALVAKIGTKADNADSDDGDGVKKSMFINTGSGKKTDSKNAREPSPKAKMILDDINVDPKWATGLELETDKDSGETKFRQPIRQFFKGMKLHEKETMVFKK